MAKHLTSDQVDRIVALVEQGLEHEDIAQQVGCHESTVGYHAVRLGAESPFPTPLFTVPTRPIVYRRGGRPVRRFTRAEDELIIRLAQRYPGQYTKIGLALIPSRLGHCIAMRLMFLARRAERSS